MQSFFGRAKGKQPTAEAAIPTSGGNSGGDAMAQCADSKSMIDKRTRYLQKKIDDETKMAIAHKENGRKPQALLCLKNKKQMEQELEGLLQRTLKITAMENSLAQLKFTELTIAAEKAAAVEIKERVKRLGDLDAVRDASEDALQDAYEALGIANEQVAVPGLEGIDDESLLEELDSLGNAKADEQHQRDHLEAEEERRLVAELAALPPSGGVVPAPSFPRAPREDPAAQRRQEEEREELAELDRLQAAMKIEHAGGMAMLGSGAAMPRGTMVPVA